MKVVSKRANESELSSSTRTPPKQGGWADGRMEEDLEKRGPVEWIKTMREAHKLKKGRQG